MQSLCSTTLRALRCIRIPRTFLAALVHVVDWATRSVAAYDLTPATGSIAWDEIAFDASGDFALLVGSHGSDGVVYRFDDAAYRAGGSASQIAPELTAARRTGRYAGVAYPWTGGSPHLLRRTSGIPSIAALHVLDPSTGNLTSLPSFASGAGCDDLAFATDAFAGVAILVVCGTSGSDARYLDVALGEWISVGSPSFGNLSSAAAHLGGDYALVVEPSSSRLGRFQAGVVTDHAASISFPTRQIFDVAFQQGGQRALIVGRATGALLSAAVPGGATRAAPPA